MTALDTAFVNFRLSGHRGGAGPGDVLRPITDRLLRAAGIGDGTAVVDLYCGDGDLSLAAADHVGRRGRVVGIDSCAHAIDTARRRAVLHGYNAVTFSSADMYEFRPASPFDAAISRYVLTGQRDPVGFLRSVSRFVRPGGVLAIHEMDMSRGIRSVPPLPDLRYINHIIEDSLDRIGVLPDAGGRLIDLFDEAGLPLPTVVSESIVASGHDRSIFALIASVVRCLMPHLAADEIARLDVDTMEERLRQSAMNLRSQVEFIPQVCAWTRLE
jgi:SAM-dependent methyltransferase